MSWSRAACRAVVKLARSGFVSCLDRGDHGHPEQLVDGQQCPDLLLESGSILGAQHVPVEHGVPQRQIGDLDLPAFVVEPDQLGGRMAVVVQQGGDQPVTVADRLPSVP